MQVELLQLDLLNKFGLIKKYLYEKWNFNVGSVLFQFYAQRLKGKLKLNLKEVPLNVLGFGPNYFQMNLMAVVLILQHGILIILMV